MSTKIKLHLNPIEIDIPEGFKVDNHLWQWLQNRAIESLQKAAHNRQIHPSLFAIDGLEPLLDRK